jgi:alkanesulfonate monooxygenase SsuD/methylene tetrahydromethanopterin reductase-like flavin-dependent oxidoreductase (luciferase family)
MERTISMADLQFGVITLQHLSYEEEVKRWQKIEELGFDSIWVADHFVNYANPTEPWLESWTLISALAAVTKRVSLGTLVSSFSFRNPAVLARQALTVDHISNGRLEIGLGAGPPGNMDPSFRMTGVPDWSSKERVGRFREYVQIIDQCLTNEVSSFDGKYYKLEGTTMVPQPVQKPRPPIVVAAMGKSMLNIAAAHADTWNSYGGEWEDSPEKMLENTKQRNELLDKYCDKIDRDPATLKRSILFFGAVASKIFESEDSFRQTIDQYREVGISEFIVYYPFYDPNHIPVFEKVAKTVIPELKTQ